MRYSISYVDDYNSKILVATILLLTSSFNGVLPEGDSVGGVHQFQISCI